MSFISNLGIKVFNNSLQYFLGYKASYPLSIDCLIQGISFCSEETTHNQTNSSITLHNHVVCQTIQSFTEQILKGMSITFSLIKPFIKISVGYLLYYKGKCKNLRTNNSYLWYPTTFFNIFKFDFFEQI